MSSNGDRKSGKGLVEDPAKSVRKAPSEKVARLQVKRPADTAEEVVVAGQKGASNSFEKAPQVESPVELLVIPVEVEEVLEVVEVEELPILTH